MGMRRAEAVLVAKKKWSELSPRTRRLIIAGGVFDAVLKVAALIDLARRPASDVRGSRARWALAVTLINSVGAVPVAYFACGRRRSDGRATTGLEPSQHREQPEVSDEPR
jgi:hypothetical protein